MGRDDARAWGPGSCSGFVADLDGNGWSLQQIKRS